MRRLACAIALVAIWIGVIGWAAGMRWNGPWHPPSTLGLAASDFRVVMGAGVEDGEALRVGAVGDDGNALQTIVLKSIHASDFPVLRYHFEGFPRTLELSLVFRRADSPDEVQAVTVPTPGDGWYSVDLRGIPGWQGDIIELGFAEYATAQLVPPSIAFKPFRFDSAELAPLSWSGGLGVLYTSWFAYVPWALLSVSALAPDRGTLGTSSPVPVLVLGSVLSLAAAALILGWSRPRLLRRIALAAFLIWAVLDLRWLHDFHGRHALTEDLYAGKSWDERQRLLPDQDIASAAEQIRNWLAAQPPGQRVLVAADAKYVFLRLIWLLLPHNAALLSNAAYSTLPHGSLILLYASTEWVYDAERGMLTGATGAYVVEPVFNSGGVRLFRVRRTTP